MNKFKLYFFLFTLSFSFFSCEKDERSIPVLPPRDYAVQNETEKAIIKEFLDSNYISLGVTDDLDVSFKKIDNGQPSVYSLLNSPTYPKLLVRKAKFHNVDYDLYHLVLKEGVGEAPCNLDQVLAAYKGSYLSRDAASVLTTTFFEESRFPTIGLNLGATIPGWGEIFPQFKAGKSSVSSGKVSFSNFGAGVMFLPSALAYYNVGNRDIPAYTPLIFSFKLYEVKRLDTDNDGVPSCYEDLDKDGYLYDYRNTVLYPTASAAGLEDTDKDGIPDFLDTDDDGDGISTFNEIKRPNIEINKVFISNGIYPFNGTVDEDGKPYDDPTTENINEGQGIPSYKDGKEDNFVKTDRIRVHLDKNNWPK
jgi:hypothetical protein